MKMMKKMTALLAVLVLVMSLLGVPAAWADGPALELKTERSGDTFLVSLVTAQEVNFGGLSGTLQYDEKAFSLNTCRAGALQPMVNGSTGKFVADTGTDDTLSAGTVLLTFQLDITEKYQEGKEYLFNIELDSAYNFSLEDYTWAGDSFFQSSAKATETTEPVPASNPDGTVTVTYKDKEGKVLYVETVEPGEELVVPDLAGQWALDGQPYEPTTAPESDMVLVLDRVVEAPAEARTSVSPWWFLLLLIPAAIVIWLILGRRKGGKRQAQ